MTPDLKKSIAEAIDGLEAAIGLDDRQKDPIHALIVVRAVSQGYAVKIEFADPGKLVEKSCARHGLAQLAEHAYHQSTDGVAFE